MQMLVMIMLLHLNIKQICNTENTENNGTKNGVKIALKHLSNFSRSLEIPFINCKVEL